MSGPSKPKPLVIQCWWFSLSNVISIFTHIYYDTLPFDYKHVILIVHWNYDRVILLVGPMNNLGLEMLSSMFGGLGAGSLAVPNRSNG